MRVQVNLSDEMVKRIDEYSSSIGLSRSALCAVAVGQYMDNIKKVDSVVKDFAKMVEEQVKNQ